jgi:hypothetical protein
MAAKTVSMKMIARFFIAASVISLAVSLTGPGSDFLWGFLKPLSALLFGAFFITNLLAKEYAQYDEEHERRMELARKQKTKSTIEDDEVSATGTTDSLPLAGEQNSVQGEPSAEPEERESVSLRDR